MIRHLVALRFAEDTDANIKKELMNDLAGLSGHIDGILDFQVRENVSVEDELVRGFRHLFWFDFRDEAVRDIYLEDPVHKSIGARIVAALDGGPDDVFVIDFQA